jgi:DNA-binding beta-propeller fold protein YncE
MKILKKQKIPVLNKSAKAKDHNGMRNIGPMPQDVKISPDGKTFYIADMMSDGLWIMKAPWSTLTLLKTGKGSHGLYVTRDSQNMIITNRNEGTISILRFSDNKLIAKWKIPGGGSPDMGGISADGKIFWVSGRYDNVVYAISTTDGHLIKKIKVGTGPHGLAVYPQPGRYSLGHTGVFR